MSLQTKIQLSDFERELLNSPDWILTKNGIVRKAMELLGAVEENLSDYTRSMPGIFPEEVIRPAAKISKGENYLGLPWLMLDFPRYFEKENIFAIRTMFWWGKFFSTTLHLGGVFKERYHEIICSHYEDIKTHEFYVCVNDDQWHHHLETENYMPVKDLSITEFQKHLQQKTFLKLSKKLSLRQWDHAIRILSDEFVQISKWLH